MIKTLTICDLCGDEKSNENAVVVDQGVTFNWVRQIPRKSDEGDRHLCPRCLHSLLCNLSQNYLDLKLPLFT